tara:strand:+ start:1042 stop:1305 length:264 start_codon:yes stop_codon:yes gene_type:complete
MIKVSKYQFKKDLKKHFTSKSGLSIATAKQLIKKQIKINCWDNSIKISGVRLFFTDNINYSGGVKNGFGKGFYLTSVGFTGGSEIKL